MQRITRSNKSSKMVIPSQNEEFIIAIELYADNEGQLKAFYLDLLRPRCALLLNNDDENCMLVQIEGQKYKLINKSDKNSITEDLNYNAHLIFSINLNDQKLSPHDRLELSPYDRIEQIRKTANEYKHLIYTYWATGVLGVTKDVKNYISYIGLHFFHQQDQLFRLVPNQDKKLAIDDKAEKNKKSIKSCGPCSIQ